MTEHPTSPATGRLLRWIDERAERQPDGRRLARFRHRDVRDAVGLDGIDTELALCELTGHGLIVVDTEPNPLEEELSSAERAVLAVGVPGLDRVGDRAVLRFVVELVDEPARGCARCEYRGHVADDGPAVFGRWKPCPYCEPRCTCGRLATIAVASPAGPIVLRCGRYDE